jgi:hypothetical protein
MTIDTTFLPKTNGLVFGDRLVIRSDKGRVFLLGESSDPLAVANGQGANWIGSNVYEVGKTVEGRTAAYTGGVDPVTYRYRFQTKAVGSDTWVNQAWTNTTNAKNPVTYTLTEIGQIKLQSQARDSSDPTAQLNSVTGIKSVEGIGDITATVEGSSYDLVAAPPLTVLVQDPIALAVQKSGSANVTYTWTVRSPATAVFSNSIGASTDVTIATSGVATVQCTIQSLGQIETIAIQFFTVDAL